MNNTLVPEICTGWLLCLWFLNTRLDRSSISPASLFLGYWFFNAFCPMLAWRFALLTIDKMGGYLTLAAAGTLVFLASALFRPGQSRAVAYSRAQVRHLSETAFRHFKLIYGAILTMAYIYPIALYHKAKSTLGVTSIFDMPSVVSEARYLSDWNPGFFVNGLNTFVFTAAAMAGFLAADLVRRRQHLLLIASGLLPGVATYYLTAARTGLLFSAVFWLGSYLASASYFGYHRRFSFGRFLIGGLLLVTLTLPVVHIGYMIRTSTYDWKESMEFWDKSISTTFGHISVLGYWLASDDFTHLPPFEFKTMAGITEKLGLATREQGLYNVSYAIGADDSVSNIYTVFRPLIEDGRGLPGAGVILVILAGLSSFAWHKSRGGSVLAVPLVFCFHIFTLWGLITSIFIYLSTILAALLSSILFLVILTHSRAAERARVESLPCTNRSL